MHRFWVLWTDTNTCIAMFFSSVHWFFILPFCWFFVINLLWIHYVVGTAIFFCLLSVIWYSVFHRDMNSMWGGVWFSLFPLSFSLSVSRMWFFHIFNHIFFFAAATRSLYNCIYYKTCLFHMFEWSFIKFLFICYVNNECACQITQFIEWLPQIQNMWVCVCAWVLFTFHKYDCGKWLFWCDSFSLCVFFFHFST